MIAFFSFTMIDRGKGIKEQVEDKIAENNVNEAVSDYLRLIVDNTLNGKNEKDLKNELVSKLFKDGFEIHNPSGTKKISSKVVQQVMWRLMSKIKMLSTSLHCTGKDENEERITSEGVATVTKRGNLPRMMAGKDGVFWKAFLKGNGYLRLGKDENSESPVSFSIIRRENLFVDRSATSIRGVNPATRLCVIEMYDKKRAYNMWPELKENNICGRIPGTYDGRDNKNQDFNDNEIVEVAWGWDLVEQQEIIFAGTQGFLIDEFRGKEYGYMKNKKPYIPVFSWMCQPNDEEFDDVGVGEMVYDLALIAAKLFNMELGHIEENVYPVTLINAPQAKVNELVEKMSMANEARAMGGKPFVAMEFGQSGGTGVQAQTLLTQNLFNEWNVVWDRLYRELSRLGINVDDIERGSGITRGQVIAEEEASNAFVAQMQEYNSWETEEFIECVMEMIKENVSNSNKSPLNLLTDIKFPDGSSKPITNEITMGQLAKTLKNGNWFAVTDKRTGYIPSDLTKMIQEERLLSMTPPNTPEYSDLRRRIAMRMGIESNVAIEPAPQQGGAAPGGEPQPPIPAETQRVLPEAVGSVNQPV